MSRILIAEDEPRVSALLEKGLRAAATRRRGERFLTVGDRGYRLNAQPR